MNIYIETYGCSANVNNSEILAGILTQSSHIIVKNSDIADIIIINSCIVKSKTENKIKRRIQDLSKLKKLIIVAGCMPETDFKELKKLNSKVLLIGTHHFKEINNLIKNYRENQLNNDKEKKYIGYFNEEKLNLPKIPKNKLISIVQISEGCLGNCTYCKTRLAKGKLFSYYMNKILKTIENDLNQGAKEVWITSQDNASYGLDKENKKPMLVELLKKILSLKHNFKLRLGMMNPNNVYSVLNELIEVYKNKKMYKFLHIPIQSACDSILKDMKRDYKIKIAEDIINKFRAEFPDIVIATDIIVGYSTETDACFKENINFIEKYKPDVFNLSKFSRHKNTEAGKLKQLSIDLINKRAEQIMNLHRQTALENKQKFLDKTLEVFVNNKIENNLFEARDENYNIVLIKNKDNILGKHISVVIRQVGVHHLIGEVVIDD
jgi:threonylcarbamoyladenosine tRNA methylthiotransferase CDKAL1